jgi:hypothetical protein
MMTNGRRCALVVPLSSVRMACHLVPRYHTLDPAYRITSSTDLLTAHNQFFFNKYASNFIFVIIDYWRRQQRGRQ